MDKINQALMRLNKHLGYTKITLEFTLFTQKPWIGSRQSKGFLMLLRHIKSFALLREWTVPTPQQ